MKIINTLVNRYKALPKALRFTLYYGTGIAWGPVMFILLVAALVVLTPIKWVVEAWEEFK